MDRRTSFLVKLARQSAATWHALCAQTFAGEVTIETENTIYLLHDGVFASRAKKADRVFETPPSMKGARLLGFLCDEGGFWSISPRWRKAALAVFWRAEHDNAENDPKAIVLTSATVTFARKEPEPQPWVRPATGAHSTLRRRGKAPTLRRPTPPSMTRVLKNMQKG